MGITVERCFDESVIKSVMLNDYVLEVMEDGAKEFKIDQAECWLGIYDKELIGVCNFHEWNGCTIEMHFYMLKDYRMMSCEAVLESFRWLMNDCRDKLHYKIVILIPECYQAVYNFTRRWLKDEGINRQSFIKNGKIFDQHFLGITKEEIEGLFNE